MKRALVDKDLRSRFIYTFLILVAYTFLLNVPIPGVNSEEFKNKIAQNGGTATSNLIDTLLAFTGGSLSSLSILALGISPYITASIIIQLLQMDMIPKMAEWHKQGQKGRDKTSKATRILAVVLGFVQGYGLTTYVYSSSPSVIFGAGADTANVVNVLWDRIPWHPMFLFYGFIFTIGMAIMVWLGDRITKKGIGNGVSILILAGILNRVPSTITSLYSQLKTKGLNFDQTEIIVLFAALVFVLVVLLLAIYLQIGERRLVVQYANRKNPFGHNIVTYLPLKVNGSGVIPVIFVGSLMALPEVMNIFFPGNGFTTWFNSTIKISGQSSYSAIGLTVYSLMLYLFSFFYVTIQLDPVKISDNISRSNGYISGYLPGKETEKYIGQVINRINILGGLLLAIIAVLPLALQTALYYYTTTSTGNQEILTQITSYQSLFQFGGTGLLIVVSVAIQLYKRINGRLSVKNYQRYKITKKDSEKTSNFKDEVSNDEKIKSTEDKNDVTEIKNNEDPSDKSVVESDQ
jgi:preprotein translocase subunit SecY